VVPRLMATNETDTMNHGCTRIAGQMSLRRPSVFICVHLWLVVRVVRLHAFVAQFHPGSLDALVSWW